MVAQSKPMMSHAEYPTLIVEVLSDSAEASDRGEKFAHLQRLAPLKEYALVNLKTQRVEVFQRGEGVAWVFVPYGEGAHIELSSIGVTIDVADVYRDPNA